MWEVEEKLENSSWEAFRSSFEEVAGYNTLSIMMKKETAISVYFLKPQDYQQRSHMLKGGEEGVRENDREPSINYANGGYINK